MPQPLTAPTANVKELSERFNILSSPWRIHILMELAEAPQRVTDLCARFELDQSTMSNHVKRLASTGSVRGEKQGHNIWYSPTELGERMLRVIREIGTEDGDV